MRKLLIIMMLLLVGCSTTTVKNEMHQEPTISEITTHSDVVVDEDSEVEEPINVEEEPTIDVIQPDYGQIYAHITCERIGLDKDIYYGDDEVLLKKSLGQYTGSHLFGEGNVILVAGHNGTHFKAIRHVEKDDEVVVTTEYGTFTYKVYDTTIRLAADFNDEEELNSDEEILIMYTCYPFNSLSTDKRFFVYASLSSYEPKEQ